ncbi:MAG: hypothetical protein R2880_07350 [Deinococcales bacterium]
MNSPTLHPSFIEKEGKREYVVLPIEEFEQLQIFLEDAQDLFELRLAKAEDDGEYLGLAELKKELGL